MPARAPRLVPALAALLLVVSACAGSDDDTATPGDAEPASTQASADGADTDAGDTDARNDGRTIIALDETAAIGMLTLGITPDTVLTTLTSETFAAINADLGIATTDFVIAEPSFELLAGLTPDLIVGIGSPFVTQSVDEYEQIAPTTVIPIDVSWQEQLTVLADALDATERADAVIRAVDTYANETADAIADAGQAGTSVSLLTVRVGNVLAADGAGSTGSLLAAAGLTRPAPQQAAGPGGTPFLFISEETVVEHDADVILLAEAAVFDLQPLLDSPVYAQLGAVQSGDVHIVVGDAWMVGGTGFAAYWALSDMQTIFVDGAPVATLDDTPQRWAAFLDLVG
ncbi:MAG: ABC transporter substrate-binding protein [Actinomycetota bacterium]